MNTLLDSFFGDEISPKCSRAKCLNSATTKIIWRNPKIHTADKQKIWLACAEHKQYLADYLKNRNFPVLIENF